MLYVDGCFGVPFQDEVNSQVSIECGSFLHVSPFYLIGHIVRGWVDGIFEH